MLRLATVGTAEPLVCPAALAEAMRQAKYEDDGDPRTSGPGFGVTIHSQALLEPLGWRKVRHVFVDSMADVLHARVPTDFVAQVWAVMALTPHHTYQMLTKRPERYAKVLTARLDRFRTGVPPVGVALGVLTRTSHPRRLVVVS
jgi:protein gp37